MRNWIAANNHYFDPTIFAPLVGAKSLGIWQLIVNIDVPWFVLFAVKASGVINDDVTPVDKMACARINESPRVSLKPTLAWQARDVGIGAFIRG